MAKVKTVEEVLERATQLDIAYLDKNGHEVVDSTPMAPPIGYREQPSMMELVQAQVRAASMEAHLESLVETEEDADDFEISDDPDSLPGTPWENDKEPSLKDARKRREALEQALAEADAIEARSSVADQLDKASDDYRRDLQDKFAKARDASKSARSASKAQETPSGGE